MDAAIMSVLFHALRFTYLFTTYGSQLLACEITICSPSHKIDIHGAKLLVDSTAKNVPI